MPTAIDRNTAKWCDRIEDAPDGAVDCHCSARHDLDDPPLLVGADRHGIERLTYYFTCGSCGMEREDFLDSRTLGLTYRNYIDDRAIGYRPRFHATQADWRREKIRRQLEAQGMQLLPSGEIVSLGSAKVRPIRRKKAAS